MLLILFFFLIAVISLKIRVNFKNIKISNINEKGQKTKLTKIYDVEFEIFIFNIIKIAKIKFNNKKSRKVLQKIKDMIGNMSNDMLNWKELVKRLKEFKMRIKKANVQLMIGTFDIITTIGAVSAISIIVPILIRDKIGPGNASKIRYQIIPIYNNENTINLEANGITELYLVHIIYALYIIKMKGRNRNVRRNKSKSSDRRTYGYSNE